MVKSATSYLSPICHPGDEEDFPFFYHFAGQEFFVFSDGSRNSPDLEMITGRYSDGGVKWNGGFYGVQLAPVSLR
ncbi:MAG: hypothetical protein ACOC2E_05600 [Bacteroidota bacterium]